LYLYTNPGHPLTPAARAYLDFVLSTEGQNSITMTSFATLAPSLSSETYSANRLDTVRDAQDGGHTRIRPGEVRAFEEVAGDGNRLSITFRFQSGTSDLDSRGERDVGRLVELMALPANADKRVVLIGYSSANGDYIGNRDLSRERANSLRDRLVNKYGMKDVVSAGVGSAAAVSCNLDPASSSLNQRVEVWLRKRT
jgi:phosphate transport system substrate-binding protein